MSRLDEIRDFLDPECCVMEEYDAAIIGHGWYMTTT